MSVYRGKKIKLEIIGSSHAKNVTVKIGGLKGLTFNPDEVTAMLERRSSAKKIGATERVEIDRPNYLHGVKNGRITGKIIAEFENKNINSNDYADLFARPRPSHADVGRYFKFGELDFTGGGEFSGRMTVALCLAGAIAKSILKTRFDTEISAKCSEVGILKIISDEKLAEELQKIKDDGDSVGARVECKATNVPVGLGGALFDGLEGKISSLIFAIPAVKGVSFGKGFDLCNSYGSISNDSLAFKDGKLTFLSNNDGGIYGGISCGEITLSVAFKPISSIKKEQNTVDLSTGENVKIKVKGRHDVCAAIRALPVVEAAVALAILDEVLYEKY